MFTELTEEERSAAEKRIEALTNKVVRMARELPPEYAERDGKVFVRTVWREFVVQLKSRKPDDDSYCANQIRELITFALHVLDPIELRDLMNYASAFPAEGQQLQKLTGQHVSRHACLVNLVFGKVCAFATGLKIVDPYREIRWIKAFNNHSDLPAYIPEARADYDWPWLLPSSSEPGNVLFVPQAPREICRQACQAIWSKADSSLRGRKSEEEGLPGLVEEAIKLAEGATQLREVEVFLQNFVAEGVGGQRANQKLPALQETLQHGDPALFFEFARSPLLSDEEADSFVKQLMRVLTELCPSRESQIAEVLLCVVRRLLGDRDAVYPLLYGPAGTAKTFLVEQLAEAFSDAGLRVANVLQPMTQLGGYSEANNEVAMSLQGTSSRWGDGRYGMMYRNTFRRSVDLCLIALDETDKCALQDYMVTLLDPRQALQDSFVREYVPSVDMRSKTLFFLTANDITPLRGNGTSPLWSRLMPIEMPGYSDDEACELVCNLVTKRSVEKEGADRKEVMQITRRVMTSQPSGQSRSVRALIDRVNRELFLKRFPDLQKALIEGTRQSKASGRRIGFSL